ncbi:ABC transporter I family member chloroplastic [Chlorella sorokiniana]|uniref:ABC transporter I family member chloroplastic n=1 Tax=Chlorella sorokiniana TaxID=3076 RepID=A0A2P6TE01_CHLSO|nr:ABC transporter I family member chloroplastic [Chlorella sorokiniana]|eukprot:PRW20876.1 ABC transporter I family member chloroplastic [Chlorella sorokiniana]
MSSKLLKSQLHSVIRQRIDKREGSSGGKGKKQGKRAAKRAKKQPPTEEQQAQTLAANLKYFARTTEARGAAADLVSEALAKKGFKPRPKPAAPQPSKAAQAAAGEEEKSLVAAAAASSSGGSAPQQGETLADVMGNIMQQLMAMQQQGPAGSTAAHLHVADLGYQPPGAPAPLLTDVSMSLPPNQLGLVFGRSGAGKTTLLQLVAGLAQPSSGSISFSGPAAAAAAAIPGNGAAAAGGALPSEARMAQAGLVFQFPERHFIGRTMSAELTVGWPLAPEQVLERQALAVRTHQVLAAVGLEELPLDVPLAHLSDGYKRRVALAVQLVRRPRLLLLDEPLAGLDWRTRHELIDLLKKLKAECTMLVVSHDLRELAPLVDAAWEMRPGGRLEVSSPDRLPML